MTNIQANIVNMFLKSYVIIKPERNVQARTFFAKWNTIGTIRVNTADIMYNNPRQIDPKLPTNYDFSNYSPNSGTAKFL